MECAITSSAASQPVGAVEKVTVRSPMAGRGPLVDCTAKPAAAEPLSRGGGLTGSPEA